MASVFARRLTSAVCNIARVETRLLQPFAAPHWGEQQFYSNDSTKAGKHRIDVGILGLGRISEIHLRNVLANRRLRLNWVIEENETRAKEMQAMFHLQDVPLFKAQDFNSLLDSDTLDGVIILTPIPTHTDLSCRALEKGKAVFVEKPVGQSTEDIHRCFDTAARVQKPFVVGFNRRFDATFSNVHKEVTNGTIGKLQYIHLTTRDSPKPSYDFLENCDTDGCAILTDLAVHDIDHLVWITHAQKPEQIYVVAHAHDQVMAKFGEADALAVFIKYPDGAMAALNSFRESVYGYDIRSEVFGSDGMVWAGNPRYASTVVDQAHGGSVTRLQYSFPQRFKESFEAEMEHFCDCVQGVASPLVTKEESLMVAEIVARGLESFHKKRPVYF